MGFALRSKPINALGAENEKGGRVNTNAIGTSLTGRELEILGLIATGKSAKEAAIVCGIAPRTVETHLDTIRVKLRARNRVHMVAIAFASAILSVPLETRLSAA